MAIVYEHYRKTNNEIFYVGLGKEINRAYSKKQRNQHWKNIVSKDGYYVKVVANNLSIEEAINLEKELITKYGRKDLGLGPLVNMTDGGESTINISNETRQKLSLLKQNLYDGENNPAFKNKKSKLPLYIRTDKRINKEHYIFRLKGKHIASFDNLEEAIAYRDNYLKTSSIS